MGKLPKQQYKNTATTNTSTHMITGRTPKELATGSSFLMGAGSSSSSQYYEAFPPGSSLVEGSMQDEAVPLDMPRTPSVPYAITQRKSAAASLFTYDNNAPDYNPPVARSADEMVEVRRRVLEKECYVAVAN